MKRFGRVLGGFGEGLGRVWEGFGESSGGFQEISGREMFGELQFEVLASCSSVEGFPLMLSC